MTDIKIVPIADLPAGYQYVDANGDPVEVVEEIVKENQKSDHHNSDHRRRSDHRHR